jgi:hypothetical protein
VPQATHLASAALTLAGGALLLALAFPQVLGGVKLIAQERTLDDLGSGNYTRKLSPAEITYAAARWSEAAPLIDDSDTWASNGDILLAAAALPGKSEAERRRLVALAGTAYRKAITLGPANARAWTMLAFDLFADQAPPAQLFPLLRMSLRTGPREPGLSFPRLDVALYYWRLLDPQLRVAMQDQVLIAAYDSPIRLAELTHRRYMLGAVRDMLGASPYLKWRFDDLYSRLYP